MAQQQRRRRTRKSKKSGSSIWLMLLFLALIVTGLYMIKDSMVLPDVPNIMKSSVTIEQAEVSGENADYRKTAISLRNAVEGYLTEEGGVVRSIAKEDKEDSRSATKGKILWSQETVVYSPIQEFKPKELEKKLQPKKGKVTVAEAGTALYEGEPLPQYTIILEDELDGNSITMLIERIYIEPIQEKREIQKKTEEKKKIEEKKANSAKKSVDKTVGGGRGKIALVIDDFGYSSDIITVFNRLDVPMTYAVLPYKDYSSDAATSGAAAGKQIILHLPLESTGNVTPEPTTIRTVMSGEEIRRTTAKAIASIPYISGVNNHQGSKATADSRVMKEVLQVIKDRGLFFVDSHTNPETVGMKTARSLGIPTGINELFLDNDNSVGAIEAQLEESATMARAASGGYVIVIGHARPNTAIALQNMIPKLQAEGIEFVFVRNVLY